MDMAAHHPQDPQTGPPGAVGRPEAAKVTSWRRIRFFFKIFFFKKREKVFSVLFLIFFSLFLQATEPEKWQRLWRRRMERQLSY